MSELTIILFVIALTLSVAVGSKWLNQYLDYLNKKRDALRRNQAHMKVRGDK